MSTVLKNQGMMLRSLIAFLLVMFRSLEDTEKLRRKYMKAKRFYEEKVRSVSMY